MSEKIRHGVFHWDAEKKCIVDGPAPRRGTEKARVSKTGDDGGVSLQIPPGWDDGSGRVRHVKDGPLKGRVCWSNRAEAREIAARVAAKEGQRVTYDPN